MKITVTDIFTADGVPMVKAECAVGNMCGVWHYKEAPVIGQSYGIEFSFNEFTAVNGGSIEVLKSGSAEISTDGTENVFTAEIEDIDEIYYLRFSFDGLSMLDIEDPPAIDAGDYIRFTLPCGRVGIYPY